MSELMPAVPVDLDNTVGGAIVRSVPASKGFTPTKKHAAYIDCWCDPTAPKTYSAIAKLIGVTRKTIYNWLEQPAFVVWFNAEMDRRTDHLWKPVLLKATQLAMQGSPEHMKILAQIRGELREGSANSSQVGVVVNVGVPRPGDHVELPADAPRPSLPPARSESEH